MTPRITLGYTLKYRVKQTRDIQERTTRKVKTGGGKSINSRKKDRDVTLKEKIVLKSSNQT